MDIRIETQGLDLPAHAPADLCRRIRRAMRHVEESIGCLRVHLRDVNGAKGGRDKQCTVCATLVKGGEIVVIDRSSKLPRALFRCLRRSRALVRKEIRRRRRQTRQRIAQHLAYGA